jgi:hypothetical protein
MAVRLVTIQTCDDCDVDFEGVWVDAESDTIQDMAEAPVADQTCPNGHVMKDVEYPGWAFMSEAG